MFFRVAAYKCKNILKQGQKSTKRVGSRKRQSLQLCHSSQSNSSLTDHNFCPVSLIFNTVTFLDFSRAFSTECARRKTYQASNKLQSANPQCKDHLVQLDIVLSPDDNRLLAALPGIPRSQPYMSPNIRQKSCSTTQQLTGWI